MVNRKLTAPKSDAERAEAFEAVTHRISEQLRDRYVAYCRLGAELSAWAQVARDDPRSREQEQQLRTQHASAMKSLMQVPTESVADLALKLQIIKDERSRSDLLQDQAQVLQEVANLAIPLMDVQAQLLALHAATKVLLNSMAADKDSLARAHRSVMKIVEDSLVNVPPSDPDLIRAAKEELDSLFTWID